MDSELKLGEAFWLFLRVIEIFILVSIKWNGKPVENIKVCEGQQISELKRTIEDNCGVPAKKQKLLFKGKILKVKNII